MTYPTIMPALTLDFKNSKQLDPRVTFNREQSSGQSTYTNSRGEVVYAYAHEPRFEAEGLLLEPASTNYITNSIDFSTANGDWTHETFGTTSTLPVVSTPDQGIAPDGTNTATRLQAYAGDGRSVIDCSRTTNSRKNGSIWMKSNTGANQTVYLQDQWRGDTWPPVKEIVVTPEWKRFYIAQSDWKLGASESGDATIDILIWGAQVEEGRGNDNPSTYTSYIPTSGTELTRAPDIARVDMSDVITTTGPFTTINRPFGCSSGSDTLYLYGYPHIQSVSVYDGNLSQEEINSIAPKEDEFWWWRVVGPTFALPEFDTDGQVTVDWGDGTVEVLTTKEHKFTNGPGYREIGFRLDSGTYFEPKINEDATIKDYVLSTGPAPESMALSSGSNFKGCLNLTAVDGTFIVNSINAMYSGCTSLKSMPWIDTSSLISFGDAWYGCSSLTSFPLLDTSSSTTFNNTWRQCSSLTNFPLIDTSLSESFVYAWFRCTGLTGAFPPIDTSSATTLKNTWEGCSNLTSFPQINTPLVESFNKTWSGCSQLTGTFPLIDTSSANNLESTWNGCAELTGAFPAIDTSSVTNIKSCWSGCSKLTEFPAIDTSLCDNFFGTWSGCAELPSFPFIDTSSGTTFQQSWQNCSNLVSFPFIDISSGRYFANAWQRCSKLTSFPAGFFDSWSPSNVSAKCFYNTWDDCTSLTPASVSNILDSLAVAGVAAPTGTGTNDKKITIDWDGTGDPATASAAAIDTLKNTLNWRIFLNGTEQ